MAEYDDITSPNYAAGFVPGSGNRGMYVPTNYGDSGFNRSNLFGSLQNMGGNLGSASGSIPEFWGSAVSQAPMAFDLSGAGPKPGLLQVGQQLGWGEAANYGLNQANGLLNSGLGKLGEFGNSLKNSRPVQSFLNMPGTDQLNALAGGATALNGIWSGMQQNKMAKKQFNFQKDAWDAQWGASKKQYNTELGDRAASRHRENPSKFESREVYMSKYGI